MLRVYFTQSMVLDLCYYTALGTDTGGPFIKSFKVVEAYIGLYTFVARITNR
jgi:hypothetical protein